MAGIDEVKAKAASDYQTCKGVYRNPHPAGTDEFNAYERSWMQSLKRDEARLVDKPPQGRQATKQGVASVNLYALAKGKTDRSFK